MAQNSRYTAMLEYLSDCPALAKILHFQAVEAEDEAIQATTESSDVSGNKKYIDGSVLKRFDFVINFFKAVNYAPYVPNKGDGNQSVESILDVQSLIDWLDVQKHAGNFPDFGEKCEIDDIESLSNEPRLAWLDGKNYSPPLAKYTVTIRVTYLDNTNAI